MKKKSPLVPNVAFKQVREATGLSQDAFGNLIDFSKAYVQAIELGQREPSEDLVLRTMVMTGVYPLCIAQKWKQALDFDGEPYTNASYQRFKSGVPQPVDEAAVDALLAPAKRLILASATVGKAKMAATFVRDGIIHAFHKCFWADRRIDDLFQPAAPTGGKVTVGKLRADRKLAKTLGFLDDGALPDDFPFVLSAARTSPRLDWNDIVPDTLIRNEKVEVEEERHAKGTTVPSVV